MDEVARLRAEGLGAGKIAERLGVSKFKIITAEREARGETTADDSDATAAASEPRRAEPDRGYETGFQPPEPSSAGASTAPESITGPVVRTIVATPSSVRASHDGERRRRRDDALHRLRMRRPNRCSEERIRAAETELKEALDASPDALADDVVDGIVETLEDEIRNADLAAEKTRANAKLRDERVERAEELFEARWDEEADYETRRLHELTPKEKSQLRSDLFDASEHALRLLKREVARAPLDDDLDDLVDEAVADGLGDVFGDDDSEVDDDDDDADDEAEDDS